MKFRVLETELKASMLQIASPPGSGGVISKPARIVDNVGQSLVGDTVAGNDNQFGPTGLAS